MDEGTQLEPPADNFGARLQYFRERAHKSRAVLGGLVGRSPEWVKAVENGRMQMPRLPMLLQLAEILGVGDLAVLIGDTSMPLGSVGKATHDQAPAVAEALLANPPAVVDEPDLQLLTERVDEAWQRWVRQPDQKSATAAVLPALLGSARAAVHSLDGAARRRALVELSRTYSLAQCFFAWQPRGELVWLAADRAMAAAQDADDPLAVAAASWYYAEVFRGSGQPEKATATVLQGAAGLDPAAGVEQRARWGHLQLSAAVSEAVSGRAGDAWRHWDQADHAAAALGAGYVHPWLRFGQADVDTFALRIENRLIRPAEALRRADRINLAALPSPGRRAARLLDIAEAHSLRNQHVGVVHMIDRARRESAETVRYSLFARSALADLSDRRTSVRDEARELAVAIGLAG